MKTCSRSVVPSPQPQGTSPDSEAARRVWLRDCLVEAFPGDGARPMLDLVEPAAGTPPRARSAQPLVADSAERRREDRPTFSVYRSAMLHYHNVEALCLIRNVSSGGMMGRVLADLPIGTEILVEMRSGHEVPGRVVWTHDREIGVQFEDPIEVEQVVSGMHRVTQTWRQRMPRVHSPCAATLLTPEGRQTVTVLDLSQGGAKIEGDLLRVGDDVTLAVKDLTPHRGTVRWARGGRAGIAFLTAIPFDTLALWSLQRQAEMGRTDTIPAPHIAAPGAVAA